MLKNTKKKEIKFLKKPQEEIRINNGQNQN